MLPIVDHGDGDSALVCLHFLGSSKREWTECVGTLRKRIRCIAMDLPGFGDAAEIPGYTVEEMVQAVEETLLSLQLSKITLVGHSISGKISMAIAARKVVEIGSLILIAPSPPSPEPIEDQSRARMLSMKRDRKSAEGFLDGITNQPLAGAIRERTIEDFIRCSPEAWAAWLEKGSQEDWTARVGIVECPALLITGTADPSLSAGVQEQTTMKCLSNARLVTIADCGHLPTMESPAKLTELISSFVNIV